ncbi:MAG: ATP-binding protein, partial [Candidatus Zixiibacteriota bacterium]
VTRGRAQHIADPRQFRLDFLEFVDSSGIVVSTFHRPGLPGETLRVHQDTLSATSDRFFQTVEYDVDGAHAAIARFVPAEQFRAYTGKYLDDRYLQFLGTFLDADVEVRFAGEEPLTYDKMVTGTLYDIDGRLQAVLAGDRTAEYYLIAGFHPSAQEPLFLSLVTIGGIVAAISVLAAIGLGMYITGRAKREIDNLVQASIRVAAGDFSTPVMAYEDGEFAQLADSLSDMMVKLKALQGKLAATQKIAAWQAMGRKVAHEIKNPLTPIAISADDLRRSYREQQPHFNRVLDETTSTIKNEVARVTKLLEQFVGFARMSPPAVQKVRTTDLLKAVETLYRGETESGRLRIVNNSERVEIKLDPDAFKQVLINLIKNGFEAAEQARVTLTLGDEGDDVVFCIEDTGPGFIDERLRRSFEPYVSTKKDGSGLGLVICYRIVHDHGGAIELYNRKEGGAGVKIRLPV